MLPFLKMWWVEHPSSLARVLLVFPFTFLICLGMDRHAADWTLPSYRELLFLGVMSTVVGAGIALVLSLVTWLDQRTPGLRAPWAALVVGILAFPQAHTFGDHIGFTDSLAMRHVARELTYATATGGALAMVLVVWVYQRYAEPTRRWFWVLAGGLLMVVFERAEERFGRSYGALMPLLYLSAIVTASTAGALVLGSFRRVATLKVACALAAMVAALSLLAAIQRPALSRGRRQVLVRDSSLRYVHARTPLLRRRFVGYEPHERAGAPCTSPREPSPIEHDTLKPEQRRNVIFVSIDTVRDDDAKRSVNGKPVMPELQRFVRESWRGTHAYTGYPHTVMALASAFSGVMPSRVMLSGTPPKTVFGALRHRFDDVTAVLPVLKNRYFEQPAIETYITQGMSRIVAPNASRQTDAAISHLRALRKSGKRHMLWMHFLEPHEPYVEHKGFKLGRDTRRWRYRSELAYADRHLGRLLRVLRDEGWYDDSLIVVLADHGESLGERGHWYHNFYLHPWLIRVPMAVHVPGQQPRKFKGPLHLTDIAATTLHFVGERASLPLDGLSLLQAPPSPKRIILSEEFPVQVTRLQVDAELGIRSRDDLEERIERIERPPGYASKISIIKGDTQLVVHRATNESELYVGANASLKARDTADTDVARRVSLRKELSGWLKQASASLGCTQTSPQVTAQRPKSGP